MHIDMPCFDALNQHVARHLLWDTLATLTPPGEDNAEQQQSRDQAVAEMLEAMHPGDAVQAMIASQAVALHHGAMGCYRWSMQTEAAGIGAVRLRRDAMAMTRTMIFATRELQRMQDREAAAAHPAGRPAPGPAGAVPGSAPSPLAAEPQHDPAPEPAVADAAEPAGADAPVRPAHDLTRRERGKIDLHATPAALRALLERDPSTLTDDELEACAIAVATPDHPYDPSWREIKPPPQHPKWETLTPEERRARYGWRSEEEIAAAKAAAAKQAAQDAEAADPPPGPPRPD
ncbi:MAG TPA: hypothetical protein VGG99_20300 [Acetobacteraceae bacterium]|jgi:hypothetical protein